MEDAIRFVSSKSKEKLICSKEEEIDKESRESKEDDHHHKLEQKQEEDTGEILSQTDIQTNVTTNTVF